MKKFTPLSTTAALALLAATPTVAQDRDPQVTFGEFFSPDRIATAIAHTGISALRTQMELQYDHMTVDPMRGIVSLSGIVARPQLPYDQAGQCEVLIDRVTLSSDFTSPFQTAAEIDMNLIGAHATLACFERDMAVALRTAGYRDMPIDQFKMRASYTYATGATAVDSTIAINGFGILDYSASGTILPRLGQYGIPAEPAVRVTRAVATLKDDGGWAAISQVLPENLRDPVMIREMGTQAISSVLSQDGLRPLGAVERRFVADLMTQVEAYVTDPGEITIEATLPDNGITLEPEMYADPLDLIAGLGLQVRAAPMARSQILSLDALAAIQTPDSLSPDARIALATALLDGNGVPRSTSMVAGLLEPLLDTPETAGAAAALLARAEQESDVPNAYRHALIAASAAEPGAIGLLDKLESRMTTQSVLAAQDRHLTSVGAVAPLEMVTGDDPRDLRALSLAYLTGTGQARSYARAYYYALLAEAAGDIAAESLRNEIIARFGARGPDVAQAWHALAAQVEEQAVTDWINADLPGRYLVAE
ncbi:hypothetical protein DS901_07940 [Loktanella sp. D2R18]|uniref:hypothetical protein n=1 Tax=Rhodobacterales TaxID=204455 RepID=UPI000DEA3753|nr:MULTISPECIES: hypothetical protein [Rhodobacterales]MDO6589702.1 hypothetical protein [Yoonia sp. 1_MG-2023]RBW44327.1 hypothetical protein DS901_07940 [Loktanella sp. D2R18]